MTDRLAARYRRFAAVEAHGHAPLYETLAETVAGDINALGFLAALPTATQQPNRLFAAARDVTGTPRDWAAFRVALRARPDDVRAVMPARGAHRRTSQRDVPSCCPRCRA
jgi:hypothetical protein